MSNSDDDIPLSVKLNKTNINKLSTPQSSNGGASKIAKPIKNGNGNGTAKHTNGAENLDSDDDMPLIARTKSAKPIAKKDSLKKATTTAKAKVTKAKAAKDSPAKKAETRARAPKSDFENGWSEAKADPSVPYRAPSSSVNSTPAKRKTQIKNESDDEVFETPTKSKKSSAKSTPKTTPKITPKGKVKKEEKEVDLKEEEEEEEYKWWEANAANEDETVKWVTLHHNGVLFPPPYEPHGVKMLYDGEPITLVPEVEEAVTFFAAIMQLDHANNTVFQKNFMKDLLKVIKKSKTPCPIKEFKKCNFTPIYEHLQREREERLSKTKEEKLKIKLEKDAIAEPFMWALLDGRKEKVGNFNVEPPSLFKGRGDHPKTGCIKARIQPEDVTLNLSKDAPIPPAPKGHKWGKIVHSNTSTWLANWTDSITGSGKYVFLSHDSSLKGQSDLKKFEVARKLKTYIKDIRKQYTRNLKSDDMKNKQLATAMYLIDVLAIRAGNEKGEDEADTVGCCSLRLEHIELITPNTLKFDFLGKDSIRYINEVEVSPQVFKNMKELRKGKKKSDMLFDLLNTSYLNNHLKKLMPGLTAKVFRTYNASHTFQEQLKNTNPNDSEVLKLQSFNRANRQVAILCNHQKTVSKNFDTQMEKQEDRIRAIKLDIKRVKGSILASDKKLVKSYPELEEPESDLDDDWCREFIKNKYQDAREKSKVKFEVKNEQLESNNEETVPQSKLQSQLDSYDEKESQMLNEIDTGKYEKVSDPEKLITRWQKLNESLLKQKTVKTEKDENKATALGTSKTNYIDPRITVAWSKRFGVPLERLFPKTLLTKFQWATTVDEDFIF